MTLRLRTTLGALALLLTPSCGLFGGDPTPQELMLSSLERLEETVRAEVDDPLRADEACGHLAAMHEMERALFEDVAEIQAEMRASNAQHDTSRETLERQLRRMGERRRRFRNEIVPRFVQLRSSLEIQEWKALLATMQKEDQRWNDLAK